MAEVVLDASALLALLNGESGADQLAAVLADSVISAVNLSEVVAKLAEAGMPEPAVRAALQTLPLDINALDVEQAYQAGLLRPAARGIGLSLGDRDAWGWRSGLAYQPSPPTIPGSGWEWWHRSE